jgi:hypothetical protein
LRGTQCPHLIHGEADSRSDSQFLRKPKLTIGLHAEAIESNPYPHILLPNAILILFSRQSPFLRSVLPSTDVTYFSSLLCVLHAPVHLIHLSFIILIISGEGHKLQSSSLCNRQLLSFSLSLMYKFYQHFRHCLSTYLWLYSPLLNLGRFFQLLDLLHSR